MNREEIEALIRKKMPAAVIDLTWHGENICQARLGVRNSEGSLLSVALVISNLDDASVDKRVDVMAATALSAMREAEHPQEV